MIYEIVHQSRYGLRAMLDLALNGDNGPITIHAIAQRQEISERYPEQLLIPLKQGNGKVSVVQGGYVLGRAPDISGDTFGHEGLWHRLSV